MENINELDKIFKKVLSGIELSPPDSVFSGVKLVVLEKKIVALNTQNLILKGIIVGLSLLFGSSVWYLTQKNKYDKTFTKDINNIHLLKNTDTVFVTKTLVAYDTIFVEKPSVKVVYVDNVALADMPLKQSVMREQEEENVVEKHPAEIKNEVNLATNQPVNNIKNTENQILSQEVNKAELHLDFLKNKDLTLHKFHKNLPNIEIKTNYAINRNPKPKEERLSIPERLFFEASTSETYSKLMVKNTNINYPFNEGNNLDFTCGLWLKNGWAMKVGLAYDKMKIAYTESSRQVLFAENWQGTPTYIYRNPFGNIVIPNEKLANMPNIQDKLVVEVDEECELSFLRVPIQLQYEFFARHLKVLGNYHHTRFYGFGNSFLSVPIKSRVGAELYESDGSSTHITLNGFKGLSNISFGASVGIGGKMKIGPKTSIFSEASIYRNLTYLVNNEYYQSYPKGGKISIGLHYELK